MPPASKSKFAETLSMYPTKHQKASTSFCITYKIGANKSDIFNSGKESIDFVDERLFTGVFKVGKY